jgi:hypothetical protein
MKIFAWVMLMTISILGSSGLMVQSKPPKVMAVFDGASLKWVHAAEPEFERKKLDLENYTVSIVEQNDSVIVTLSASDSQKGARGSTGKSPGYEVEINKKDMRVIRSNYIR